MQLNFCTRYVIRGTLIVIKRGPIMFSLLGLAPQSLDFQIFVVAYRRWFNVIPYLARLWLEFVSQCVYSFFEIDWSDRPSGGFTVWSLDVYLYQRMIQCSFYSWYCQWSALHRQFLFLAIVHYPLYIVSSPLRYVLIDDTFAYYKLVRGPRVLFLFSSPQALATRICWHFEAFRLAWSVRIDFLNIWRVGAIILLDIWFEWLWLAIFVCYRHWIYIIS